MIEFVEKMLLDAIDAADAGKVDETFEPLFEYSGTREKYAHIQHLILCPNNHLVV